jgi:transposase
MMGQRKGKQARLFYSFNLDDHLPADHMLRSIDRYLDLTDLHQHIEEYYSHTGRPSVDPELMIRMLLVGYCFGIRSERRLCDEVHLNLAYRWFCRLGLEDKVPDHSSFSKNRHGRFRESDVFRHVFEGVVQRCMVEGGVGSSRRIRGRCEPHKGRRQPSTRCSKRGRDRLDQPAAWNACGTRVSASAGRRGPDRDDTEEHFTDRSRGALDSGSRMSRILRPTRLIT